MPLVACKTSKWKRKQALMEAIKLYVKQKVMDCKITAKDDGNC
jgi:hypothetical protein